MEYTCITGSFHILGQSPGGDSITFRPDNPGLWETLTRHARYKDRFDKQVQDNSDRARIDGLAMLRLEGLDALVAHHPVKVDGGPAVNYRQPTAIGWQAAEALLGLFGVQDTAWRRGIRGDTVARIRMKGRDRWIEHRFDVNLAGYVVTSALERHGRPLVWVFAGVPREGDGSPMTTEQLAKQVSRSANYQLLRQGLVYPYFSVTLPAILRTGLSSAVISARKRKVGIWQHDRTASGVSVTNLARVAVNKAEEPRTDAAGWDDVLLWPVFFRKLVERWHATRGGARVDLSGLFGDRYVYLVRERDFVPLDALLELRDDLLRMNRPPEEIVILDI